MSICVETHKTTPRDSSVGRATDCKSVGHGFDPHSRDFFNLKFKNI